MNFSKKQLIVIGVVGVLLVVAVVLFWYGRKNTAGTASVRLTMWGTDPATVFQNGIFPAYKVIRPNVQIDYVQVDASHYEDNLVRALAAGKGPDIVVLHNHSLPKEKILLAPVSPAQLSLPGLDTLFPTVVEQDFVSGGQVYALPLYLDTMALLYNKDLLDQAGIASPPKTWDDVQKIIPSLRSMTAGGQLTRAAAAIGGTERTVDHGTDLLYLLMMQNGTVMTDPSFSYADFTSRDGKETGLTALNFYLQFTNNSSPVYTWNESQPNSLDGFANGSVAMIFDYSRTVDALRAKSPYLNIGVVPMPQPANATRAVTYPDYDGLAVTKQSKSPEWAWDFIVNLTTQPENAKLYKGETKTPPALRSLITEALRDSATSVFANQALTARSWHEADASAIRTITTNALTGVFSGSITPQQVIEQLRDQITQLMKTSTPS